MLGNKMKANFRSNEEAPKNKLTMPIKFNQTEGDMPSRGSHDSSKMSGSKAAPDSELKEEDLTTVAVISTKPQ